MMTGLARLVERDYEWEAPGEEEHEHEYEHEYEYEYEGIGSIVVDESFFG
jgi:hypothetical protein